MVYSNKWIRKSLVDASLVRQLGRVAEKPEMVLADSAFTKWTAKIPKLATYHERRGRRVKRLADNGLARDDEREEFELILSGAKPLRDFPTPKVQPGQRHQDEHRSDRKSGAEVHWI